MLAAAEGMLIYVADVTNAFGNTSPPKQVLHILPERVFQDWWVNSKGRELLPAGHTVPILAAMQGNPEAP